MIILFICFSISSCDILKEISQEEANVLFEEARDEIKSKEQFLNSYYFHIYTLSEEIEARYMPAESIYQYLQITPQYERAVIESEFFVHDKKNGNKTQEHYSFNDFDTNIISSEAYQLLEKIIDVKYVSEVKGQHFIPATDMFITVYVDNEKLHEDKIFDKNINITIVEFTFSVENELSDIYFSYYDDQTGKTNSFVFGETVLNIVFPQSVNTDYY